jgi:hypothetical protein
MLCDSCFQHLYLALKNAQNDIPGLTLGSPKYELYNLLTKNNMLSCSHKGDIILEEKVVKPVWIDGQFGYRFPETSNKETRKIVTLCGSTRYYWLFAQFNFLLTCAGFIVLSIGCDTQSDDQLQMMHKLHVEKSELDQLHFEKVQMANYVFILNAEDYIGESTGREIAYSRSLHKQLWWLKEHSCQEGCNCRVSVS